MRGKRGEKEDEKRKIEGEKRDELRGRVGRIELGGRSNRSYLNDLNGEWCRC